MNPSVSIVVVTYNAGLFLDACLESFMADAMKDECEILLVDNGSTDGAPERAIARFPTVELVQTGRNGGFGAGNNAGINRSRGQWVLVANPDTRLFAGGLGALVRFMEAHPAAGLIGPRLLGEDRSLQHSIRRFPTVAGEMVESLFLHRALPRLAGRFANVVVSADDYTRDRPVDWVSGAVMFARADAVRDIGGFDEGFFLYSEEVDLCRRLAESGWQTWYTPSATFMHVGGENDESITLGLEIQRSKLRYYLKHEGRISMLLVAGAVVVRLLVRSVLWLVPAALDTDRRWRLRLRCGLHVLARYPGMVARLLFAEMPVTDSALTRMADR